MLKRVLHYSSNCSCYLSLQASYIPGAISGTSSFWQIIGPVMQAWRMLRQKAKTLSCIKRLQRSDSLLDHQLTIPRAMLKTEARPWKIKHTPRKTMLNCKLKSSHLDRHSRAREVRIAVQTDIGYTLVHMHLRLLCPNCDLAQSPAEIASSIERLHEIQLPYPCRCGPGIEPMALSSEVAGTYLTTIILKQ